MRRRRVRFYRNYVCLPAIDLNQIYGKLSAVRWKLSNVHVHLSNSAQFCVSEFLFSII